MTVLIVVVAAGFVIVSYLLWVIATNQQAPFGVHWLPRWWWDR